MTQYTQQATLFDSKFVVGGDTARPVLMIADTEYWQNNEREIYNWMAEHLTNGIEHHEGGCIRFENDKQRLMFLLKWG